MKSKETISEEMMKESQFIQSLQNAESNAKEKDVYFLILITSKEKKDFKNIKFISEISPKIVFNKIIEKEDGTYLEEIVFKFKKKKEKEAKNKGEKEFMIKFIEGEHIYIISFDVKNKSFVYLPELKRGKIYLDNILWEPIKQNIIPLINKLNIFLELWKKIMKKIKKKNYTKIQLIYTKRKQNSVF